MNVSQSFRAVVTAIAAAGVGVTAFGERNVLIIMIAVVAVVFSIGWSELLNLPARLGSTLVLLIVTAMGLTLLLLTGDLAYVAIGFGLSVGLAFAHQLLRRDGRPRLVESVGGTVSGAVVVLSGVGWLAVGTGPVSIGLLLVGAVTLTVAAVISAVPLPPLWSGLITAVLTAFAGLGVGMLIDAVGPVTGFGVGLAAGLLSAGVHYLLGQFPASARALPALAAGVLPVLVFGVPVYVLGRVLLLL